MNFNVGFCNSCTGKIIKVAFQVSQGSVATQLMFGGRHNENFIAIVLLNPNMKQFSKSVNIC